MTPEGQQCRRMIARALGKYGLPCSESALRLLCMIAAHESGGFTYTKQVKGPAISFLQIEPRTYWDLMKYGERKGIKFNKGPPEQLIFDSEMSAALGRLFFMRFPEKLPHQDNITEMAEYAKRRWNTFLGAATPEDYESAYREHFT